MSSPLHRKLVIASAARRHSLLFTFVYGVFTDNMERIGPWVADVKVDGRALELALWDTPGDTDYDRLRPLSYPDTDVVLLCFALIDPPVARQCDGEVAAEVDQFLPTGPRMLVGCKLDLQHDPSTSKAVSREEAEAVARGIHAVAYIECTARTGEGIGSFFECGARAALTARGKKGASAPLSRFLTCARLDSNKYVGCSPGPGCLESHMTPRDAPSPPDSWAIGKIRTALALSTSCQAA